MKKLNLITEFDKYYKDSDLQKIVRNNPLPIKYTINNYDCFFYSADLFGLFEWKIQKNDLTTNDFINDYKNGFEQGLLHLKNEEKIKLKDLKNINLREHTISQLKYILHEREFKFGSKGLLDLVFNKVPLIFTEKNIFDYGYWNGIIYSIDDIIKKAGLTLDELKTSEPEQPGTDEPDEVKIIDKLKQNKFDDVEPSKVYQHFKQLVDNSYITNENFNLFLSTVFEQNKTLTTKIEIIKPNSKQRVQKIFYSYFDKLVQRKYGTKQKYIDLLCNNFTGFNPETLSTNFAK
ncbi:MAG TPA: hypothetical protein VLZ72_09865 [Flavobacterium sp.]|nr:hypothetical protein [Flavobacterium sp.]